MVMSGGTDKPINSIDPTARSRSREDHSTIEKIIQRRKTAKVELKEATVTIIVDNPTDDPFITKWNDFYSRVDDIGVTLGLRPVSGSPTEVRIRMPLTKAISQPGGMFAAPALFGLADITGTFLAMDQVEPGRFPLAVQSSINVVSNTKQGDAIATATLVKTGRTLIVTTTAVHDDQGKLLASVVTTYVTPR